MMLKNSYAILLFWVLCLFLILIENKSGYHWFSGIVFLLAIPVLVGYLAWINRFLLVMTSSPLQGFFLYSGVVLLTALLVVMLGLWGSSQLKLWLIS